MDQEERILRLQVLEQTVSRTPQRWLVTGAAGFIGSHIVDRLLELGQEVVALDNFATGSARNLEHALASPDARLELIEGDIRDPLACRRACAGVQIVLHQAALGSVPRSLEDPATTNAVNVDGFLNILIAARDENVSRFVYASSSAVYGDDPRLPKCEGNEGRPLSPYAVTKWTNELYAAAFQDKYGLPVVGLRYFNVFGPRQDPDGPYAAVIPRWVKALLAGQPCRIYGDGQTSRDFCYVANAVQANLLAAFCPDAATGTTYNVAYGGRTTLNELYDELRRRVQELRPDLRLGDKVHEGSRAGDIRHSQADLGKITGALGYVPAYDLKAGLSEAMPWYVRSVG